MIEWLIQSVGAHPDLARAIAPPGLLGPSELRRLAELKIEKRRRDWLLGRWTAKHLLQSYVERQTGIRPPLDALVVASDPDGAPRLIVDRGLNLQSAIGNLQLSISHCDGHALCAIDSSAGSQIGADIELVEPRSPQFAEDYFTEQELAQVRAAPPAERDTVTTLIWSAKEAALKALRLGLTVDTRSVSCALAPPDGFPATWSPLTVRCVAELPGADGGALAGWWRLADTYVLTIVVLRGQPHQHQLTLLEREN